jgi:hypothetical protein
LTRLGRPSEAPTSSEPATGHPSQIAP